MRTPINSFLLKPGEILSTLSSIHFESITEHTHTHTPRSNLESSVELMFVFLDGGRELEYLVSTLRIRSNTEPFCYEENVLIQSEFKPFSGLLAHTLSIITAVI